MTKYCPQATERMEAIGAMRVAGMTFKAIGRVLGITHQRVHQILGDYNNMLFDKFYNGSDVRHYYTSNKAKRKTGVARQARKRSKKDYMEVYQFIIDYKRDNDGNSPSYREIGEACKISSSSNVKHAIDRLIEIGKIEFSGTRSIKVLEDK